MKGSPWRLLVWSGFLVASGLAHSAERRVQPGLLQLDFPFQGAAIGATFPTGNVALKGIALRLEHGASMCFDTDLLRMSAGWTGGYITTFGVAFDGDHGGHPVLDGNQVFGTPVLPGWADAAGAFIDSRIEPFGPMPASWGRWDGLFVSGSTVTLSYTVAGTKIYEQPAALSVSNQVAFVRAFRLAPARVPLTLLICELPGGTATTGPAGIELTGTNGIITTIAAAGLPAGARLDTTNGARVVLRLPPAAAPFAFKIALWNRAPADVGALDKVWVALAPEWREFEQGGPPRWPQTVVTRGTLAASATPDGAYVTDQLTPPTENPWKRRVRFGGLDFFKDGRRAALCTWDGDIWIVSGIDEKLERLEWKRFASGMYETLGLRIVDDVIYTSGRDQITRYRDLNHDGEADAYDNFNNQVSSSEGFHEFVFDLQTDPAGNFYFAKAGPVRPGGSGFETISAHAGTLMKVSATGDRLEVVATGFRAPNGIGVGPRGEITTGDNEGTWIPTCPLNWIKPGGFFGVEDLAHRKPAPPFTPPLCWLSKAWDNSGGGQVWVPDERWGPFAGEMLHTSYGQCRLYLVLKQSVDHLMQGGVVQIPLKFSSSAMRPRFNPVDGQLYVAGLQGWQTSAARITGLDRVRYTGKPVYSVRSLAVNREGIHLTFTQPLDPASAADTENYSAQRWNYRRTASYGSPEVSVENPEKTGHDTVAINAARLSSDGRTITLTVADLKPVMQMLLRYDLTSKDGTRIKQDILHTIHSVP